MNQEPESLKGRRCYEIWHQRSEPCVGCPLVLARETGRPQKGEISSPDGRRWFVRGYPIKNEHGQVVNLAEFCLDITDQKRAEEALRESEARYRAVVEDQTELICRFLPDRTLTFVNHAYCRYFDKDQDDLLGRSFLPLIFEEDRGMVEEHFADLSKKRPVFTHEHRVISPGGETRWQRWTNRAVFDDDGRVIEFQSVGRDITERRRLEEQLRHAHKMQAVGTLAGGIAHEFNNMLQGVLGYADLLAMSKSEDDPDQKELREIIRAAKRGKELTEKMLAFSEGPEGKPRPLNLGSEVIETRRLLQQVIPGNIDVRLEISGGLRLTSADPAQVEQIFTNLALNARDAMPDGGEMVIGVENATLDEEYCSAHLEARPGEYVLLSFSDTGHGMDKKTLERAFEPFFSTRETGEGTGLGLAVVHGIVENYHGFIEASSRPGAGATFKIFLPALDLVEERDFHKPGPLLLGGEESILVVDDDAVIRELGERMLKRFGYTVITADNGESALKVYRERMGEIDLVILDLVMPDMGGERCLGELLGLNPEVKVLVTSGQFTESPVEESLYAGAKGFIGKPFELTEILAWVREVLDED